MVVIQLQSEEPYKCELEFDILSIFWSMILLRASKSLTSDGLRISTEQKYLVKAITEMLYVSEMERERVARVYQLFAFKCHRNTSVLRNSMIVRSTLMTLSMIAVIESRLFLGKNRLICRNKKSRQILEI